MEPNGAAHPDPAHPHNLPPWRKLACLLTLSLMAFVSNFEAAAHLTAMPLVAHSLRCSVPQAANAIGAGILGLGTGPLLWNPLSSALGRRPVYLGSWALFLPCIAWCALSPSLESFLAARFMAGFCSSAAQTIGAVSIAEVWHVKTRGTAIAAWTLAVIIGPLIAPLVCAAIVSRPASWRWMYYLCLILAAVVLVLILLFVPETLYTPPPAAQGDTVEESELTPGTETPSSELKVVTSVAEKGTIEKQNAVETGVLHRGPGASGHLGRAYLPWHDPKRFITSVLQPLRQAIYMPILLTCVWSAWIFTISVGTTIITPQIFEKPPFHYTPVTVGLLFIGSIIGAVGGKLVGGWVADATIGFFTARVGGGRREPELRLPALVLPTVMVLVGAIMFGDGLQRGRSWEEAIVGAGIFYFGTSAIQGIVQTYCVECDLERAASTIPLYNLIKCTFGFAAPFFIPEWAFSGLRTSYIIQGVTAAGGGTLLIAGLLAGGKRLRRAQGLPVLA